jgi:hypothetical protein
MPLLSIMVGLTLANFAERPIASEILLGARLAEKGKGIDRVLGLNRVVFGTWFDGERNRDVETAVIMTPGLLSRWLGHQQASGEKEIQTPWDRFAAQSKGKTLVFIRLATLNTLDLTDGDESETGMPELLDNVIIGFAQSPTRKTIPTKFEPLLLKKIQDIQARHPHEVLQTTWDQVASRVLAWPTTPASDPDSIIRWGRNRLVGYLAELPVKDNLNYGALQIQTGNAVRTIRFEMPKS